ncbi:hypothetical protein V2J09_017875 [Rumex salicifolius]
MQSGLGCFSLRRMPCRYFTERRRPRSASLAKRQSWMNGEGSSVCHKKMQDRSFKDRTGYERKGMNRSYGWWRLSRPFTVHVCDCVNILGWNWFVKGTHSLI